MRARRLVRGLLLPVLALALLPWSSPTHADEPEATLHLVTLRMPVHPAAHGPVGLARRLDVLAQQDRTLDSLDVEPPVYRWTHALNGYAVRLTAAQADQLRDDPRVVAVEPNRLRPLAGAPDGGNALAGSAYTTQRGGRGTVIGVVDTGLAPDSPLFAQARGLGPRAKGFSGDCQVGEDWESNQCNGKVAGARWFVDGFGEDSLATSATLSPVDDVGHGTQVASLAAGNAGVSIDLQGRASGSYSGVAPQARLSIYKACWTAPNPDDDGCSTADLVTAVDRAVGDGVDVLNLSVGGDGSYDVLERALLGAAEADVVVVAAAGHGQTVAHSSPWVTTVGASADGLQTGALQLGRSGPRLTGAMLIDSDLPSTRLVLASTVPAPGFSRQDARLCRPGSLDDRRVRGRLVVCERGAVGRVDKSAAVARAEGAGMLLLNRGGRDDISADLHTVPTLHLKREESRRLLRWMDHHRHGHAQLKALGSTDRPTRVMRRSAAGDPSSTVVKPDLVAPGAGLLSGTRPDREARWDFLTGTSGAAAQVSGLAAVLRSRHDFSAVRIRSLLATSSTPMDASPLDGGAGQARRHVRPGVVFDVGPQAYRRFLQGELGRELNTPSVMFGRQHGTATRRITNVSGRTRTFNASLSGFGRDHDVRVVPSAITLRPGQSRQFEITVRGPSGVHRADSGVVTWHAPGTTRARMPVVLGR